MKQIDIKMPSSWQALTQKQLKYFFLLLALDMSPIQIQTLCFLKWSGLSVLSKSDEIVICRYNGNTITVSAKQISDCVLQLNWLKDFPQKPVRLNKIGRHEAVSATFQGVSFEIYLCCENLYQGYIQTQNKELIDEIGALLYHYKSIKLEDYERFSIFYWLTSLRNYFAMKFPNFLKPAQNANGNLLGSLPNIEESMNTQIRALSKGDVTKEQQVLAMDTWRALTELDAQAKEYEEINKKYGSKK